MTHGTNVTYTVHGCHCDACRRANREYERARARRKQQGRSLFVPAEPVRKRWLVLRKLGMSDNEIERAAGVDDKVVSALFVKHWRTGQPIQRIKRETAERIFAVRRRHMMPGQRIWTPDAPGMVLDLMALGYSAAWIARQLGMSYQGRAALLHKTHKAATYAKLLHLHGATATPAPYSPESQRSRNFAASMANKSGGWKAA